MQNKIGKNCKRLNFWQFKRIFILKIYLPQRKNLVLYKLTGDNKKEKDMSILEKLRKDKVQAMKDKDKLRIGKDNKCY